MRQRLALIYGAALLIAIFVACDNEIDLYDPIDPIPVVYGVICPDDSVHQIKLMKTYISHNNWAIESKINDSLYFQNPEVFLDLRSDSGFVLERVRFYETIIEDKEDGLFSTSPNKILVARGLQLRYPFSNSGDMTYRLTIRIPEYDKIVFAETSIPKKPKIVCNIHNNEEINLYEYFAHPKRVIITLDDDYSTELNLYFYYDEMINDQWQSKSFIYSRKYGTADVSSSIPDTLFISPQWFYQLIKNRIQTNAEVQRRRFDSFDIQQKSISSEFDNYQKSIKFQSDFYMNTFSNIVNGIGVFTSYSQQSITGLTLHPQTQDSLALGQYTKDLKFSRW